MLSFRVLYLCIDDYKQFSLHVAIPMHVQYHCVSRMNTHACAILRRQNVWNVWYEANLRNANLGVTPVLSVRNARNYALQSHLA